MDIDPDAVPDVLLLLSEAEACLTSDVARSGVLARQALALVEATGRPLLLARALCTAAAPLLFEKDLPGAQQLYQRAVVQSQLMHDTSTLSRALNGLGLCALRQGAYAQALAFFLDGLRQTPPEDAFGRLRLLNNIGLTRMEVGDHAFALQVHEQVVALAEELGEEISVLTGLTNIIVDRYELGEYTRVLTLIEQAQPDIMRSGLVAHRVVLAIYATLCSLQLGELAQAQAAATRLLPLMEQAEAANDWDNAIHARMVCGMVAIRAGKAEAARPLLERALLLARHYRLRARERDTLLLLSETCHLLTDWRCAYDFMVAYHHLERTLHDEHVDRQIALLSDQVQIEQLNHESQTQRQQFLALLHDHELVLQSRQAFRLRANQDPLTGLANRAGFQSRGEELLSHPEQVRCAVIFLDLDGFKPVNDTYGHAAGDQVLIHVAERLKAHVRPDDLVARLGGDEFAILLTHLQQPNDALTIATNLLDAVSQPYDLTDTVASGLTVMISASVGVAVAPLSGQTLATLQRQADEAMYAAKRQGRQQIIVDAPSS